MMTFLFGLLLIGILTLGLFILNQKLTVHPQGIRITTALWVRLGLTGFALIILDKPIHAVYLLGAPAYFWMVCAWAVLVYRAYKKGPRPPVWAV